MGMQRVVVRGPKSGQGSVLAEYEVKPGEQPGKSPVVLQNGDEREFWIGDDHVLRLSTHTAGEYVGRSLPLDHVPGAQSTPLVVGKPKATKAEKRGRR